MPLALQQHFQWYFCPIIHLSVESEVACSVATTLCLDTTTRYTAITISAPMGQFLYSINVNNIVIVHDNTRKQLILQANEIWNHANKMQRKSQRKPADAS